MKFTPLALSAALLALSASVYADDTLPNYASHALYPGALMTQGFFVNVSAAYTKSVLAKNTYLSNGDKNQVLFDSPWGFAGSLGYETHVGQSGEGIMGVEAGYRYLGKLSFASVTGSSNAAPKDFRLQAGTGLIDLGVQIGRVSVIAKGGVAVQIGGNYQATTDASTTAYRFGTRVVPMAGGEIGFAAMPNVQISIGADYMFGHELNATNLGTGSNTAASGGYRALSVMAGLTYFMN